MKFILIMVVFGTNGSTDGGLALTSQQIIFNNQQSCEIAKNEILEMEYVSMKAGMGSRIGKFDVKAACVKQGA